MCDVFILFLLLKRGLGALAAGIMHVIYHALPVVSATIRKSLTLRHIRKVGYHFNIRIRNLRMLDIT
jgi:hypothetical protein